MAANDENVTAAQVGERIDPGWAFEVEVLPPCDDKHGGHWYCLTHALGFNNQLEKDLHVIDGGEHRLTWVCHEHGPEVP